MAKKKGIKAKENKSISSKIRFEGVGRDDWFILIPFGVILFGITLFGLPYIQTTLSAKPMVTSIGLGLLGISLLFIAKNIVQRDEAWGINLPFIAIIVYYLYILLNYLFISKYKVASLLEIRFQGIYLLLFLFSYFAIRNKSFLSRAPFIIILIGLLVVLNGFLAKMGIDIARYSGDIGTHMGSTLGNPNFLAGFLILIIPLAAMKVYISPRDEMSRWVFYIPAISLFVIALILTVARGAILGLIFSILLGLWYMMKRGKLRSGIAYTLGILVLALIVIRFTKPIWLAPLAVGTLKIRLIIWQGSILAFLSKPLFGYGIGTFQEVFPFFRNTYYGLMGLAPATDHAHCSFLEVLATTGIIGLILYISVIFSIIKSFKRVWEDKGIYEDTRYIVLGITGGLFAALLENQIGINQYVFPVNAVFWILCGMLMGITPRNDRFILIPKPSIRMPLVVISAIVLISAGLLGTMHYSKIISNQRAIKRLERTYKSLDKEILGFEDYLRECEKESKQPEYYTQPANTLKEAEKDLFIALQTDSSSTTTLYQAGGLYFRYATFYLVVKKYYENFDWQKIGIDSTTLKKQEMEALNKALGYYFRLEAIAPRYADIQHNIAMIYYQMGDYRKALPRLYNAAKQDVMNAYQYISIMADKGLPRGFDTPQNRQYFIKSISIMPLVTKKQARIDFRLLPADQMFERWTTLMKDKSRVRIRRLSNPATGLVNRIRMLNLTKEEVDEAIDEAAIAVRFRSLDIAEYSALLGDLFEKRNELDKAELAYLWTLNYEPDNLYSQFALFDLYKKMKGRERERDIVKDYIKDIFPLTSSYLPIP